MDIISCWNVSKTYSRHVGQRLLRHHVTSWVKRQKTEPFYALRNVTFSVPEGGSLGVCGHNGAGKSTLLSLLTGLARPDEGSIAVHGRVAALLELGSGFHPDLTGAENLRLNAALLGFSRKQVDALTDAIIDFAEIRDFINEPLRTYSSGMVLRLAFSISISLNPDILLIDEILAVGDHVFQAKCYDRMRQLRRNGTTFVCVSHATKTLLEFCDTGLLLDHGEVLMHDSMRAVVEAYEGRMIVR